MCIRDRCHPQAAHRASAQPGARDEQRVLLPDHHDHRVMACLLYTSDAADERSSVDLGGRRIIKKKKTISTAETHTRENELNTENL